MGKIFKCANMFLYMICASLAASAYAQSEEKKTEEAVELGGISIIGNQELPKTLFIVPWKNSEVGIQTDLTNTLDEGMKPVDREVFLRELEYYEFSQDESR